MEKIQELIKLIITNTISKTVFPDLTKIGKPKIDTIDIKLLIEITNEEYTFFVQKEFFVLTTFELVAETSNPDSIWIFHKIGFMNDEFEDLFKTQEMDKVNIHEIEWNKDWSIPTQILKRHFIESTTPQGMGFITHINQINFFNI